MSAARLDAFTARYRTLARMGIVRTSGVESQVVAGGMMNTAMVPRQWLAFPTSEGTMQTALAPYTIAIGRTGQPVAPLNFTGDSMKQKLVLPAASTSSRRMFSIR